jgi:hypothetical protein
MFPMLGMTPTPPSSYRNQIKYFGEQRVQKSASLALQATAVVTASQQHDESQHAQQQ